MTQPLIFPTPLPCDDARHHIVGCLPSEQVNLSQVQIALDVAYSVEDWVLAVALTYPSMQVIGLDKHERLLAAAQHRAESAGVTNASFFVQDVHTLHAARFPDQSFDLINIAFIAPAMLTLDYQALVRTLLPLCRPGGTVRWTEMEFPLTSSPALARLTELTCHVLQAAGHTFVSPWMLELNALFAQWRDEKNMSAHPIERHHLGITPMMGSWFRKAGYQSIQHVPTAIEVSCGTEAHACFVHEVERFGQHIKPFLLAQGVIAADDYEPLLAEVHDELHQESFCGLCFLLTVCAQVP